MRISLKVLAYVIVISILLTLALGIYFPQLKSSITSKIVNDDHVAVFSDIYEKNSWGGGSGSGSHPANAAPYISLLQTYFDDPRFNTIVDLGCGDWQIMSHITIPSDKQYKGFDVVPSVIAANKQKFEQPHVQFYKIKDLQDFKQQDIRGDLLVIKDVIQHWPDKEIKYFIENILQNFKYALITNEYILNSPKLNTDIVLGAFRPLALTQSPYNLQHVQPLLEYDGSGWKQVLLYTNPQHI